MKKKELKIKDLKLKSFVTSFNDETANTVKGMGSFWGGCGETMGPQQEICRNTIFPDQSICDQACITQFDPICNL